MRLWRRRDPVRWIEPRKPGETDKQFQARIERGLSRWARRGDRIMGRDGRGRRR